MEAAAKYKFMLLFLIMFNTLPVNPLLMLVIHSVFLAPKSRARHLAIGWHAGAVLPFEIKTLGLNIKVCQEHVGQ